MKTHRYAIGVDIGTTSTKAVVFTEKGEQVHQHSIDYPLSAPMTGAAEQDPEEIFTAVVQSVKLVVKNSAINPSEILCLSFSAAMHSLIAIDSSNKLLTKSITWADNRSAKQANSLKQDEKGRAIYHRTGTPIHAMSPLVKLIWLRNEQPDLFEKSAKFISIKEYVFYRIFQTYIVDYSMASATGLMDLKELVWDKEAMEIAGITEQHLSKLVPTTHIVDSMNEVIAAEMGISANTPIVIGASDGVLSNLSVGAISPGIVAVTVGTSGAVRAVINQHRTDVKERLFCYVLTDNYWVIGGAVNSGGIILRWIRDNLGENEVAIAQQQDRDPYDLLISLAQTVPPGAEGLIFHPYLAGERSPLWNANASGSFVGMTLRHTKAHLIRAMLEGIVLNLYLVAQALQEEIGEFKTIMATGGLMKNIFFRQLLADIFNCEINVPNSYESGSLGAAVLGLYALGKIPDLNAVSQMLGQSSQYQPIPENVEVYQKIIPMYTRILQQLQGEYDRLAAMATELNNK
ncbi:MAG TPA: gluconokinase [Kamptonema sp.]|nr:gluconokinase [Kamptonema sp.]